LDVKVIDPGSRFFVAASIGTGSAGSSGYLSLQNIRGIGIGLASNLSPMYIAEITPGNVRGVCLY